jgi:hypothetical protein
MEQVPASPVRQSVSFATNGSMRKCGKGSHTVPSWSVPGVLESRTRRAWFRCDSASPSYKIQPAWYTQRIATKLSDAIATTTAAVASERASRPCSEHLVGSWLSDKRRASLRMSEYQPSKACEGTTVTSGGDRLRTVSYCSFTVAIAEGLI